MNFVKQVEEHLRDISSTSATTAKSKRSPSVTALPGLKESSERAILTLRALQTQYVSAVRRASTEGSPHPKTSIFKNQDILRPFLLAANFPQVNHKTLDQAFEGIRVLGEGDAIDWKEDSLNIVRVLMIQCNVCLYHLLDEHHSSGSRIGGSLKENAGAAVGMVSSIGSSIWTGLGIGGMIGGSSSTNPSTKDQNNCNDDHDKAAANTKSHSTSKKTNIIHTSVRTIKEDEGIAIRILQLINMIVDLNGVDLTKEVLSQCISICLLFYLDPDHEERPQSESSAIGSNFPRRNSIDSTLGSAASSGSSAKKVSRAASATLRQIVSTVFDRAVNGSDSNAKDEESPEKILAKQLFSDLCDILECDDVKVLIEEAHDDPHQWILRKGAIGQALLSQQHHNLPPMKTISMDLIELVVDHQVRLIRDEDYFATTGFCAILKERLCSISIHILDVISTEVQKTKQESIFKSPMIEYYIRVLHLTAKVIKNYGHYNCLRLECLNMIVCAERIIKFATDSIRDSDEFEDGFIFEKQEDINSSSKSDYNDSRGSDSTLLAGVVIEIFYILIADHFIDLVPLFASSDSKMNDVILSKLIGSMCDFAIVASSSKGSISKVVVAAEKISSHTDDGNPSKKGGNFVLEKIQTDISRQLKESETLDSGDVVWLAFHAILFTWKQLGVVKEEQTYQSLVDGCFASSLAVIQHFIRRCPASDRICKSSLTGYLLLSDCIISAGKGNTFQRLVLLNSLCKLMFPPREDIEPRTLRKNNLYSIALLFEILNSNADNLGAEWNVVAETLAKLSLFPLTGTNQSQIISSNLSKISSLHFSDKGLVEFMDVVFSSLLKSASSMSNRRESTGTLMVDEFCVVSLQKLQRNGASIHCKSLRELPYQLVLIIDSVLENMRRLPLYYEKLAQNLSVLATESQDNNVKVFCLDILSFLITFALSKEDKANGESISAQINEISLFRPLCESIYIYDETEQGSSRLTDAAEIALNYLKQIINDGYDLSCAWLDIISALSHVARSRITHKDFNACCIIAFGCLKLVVDDFLNASSGREDDIIGTTRLSLLDCCSAFGSSSADINISLTAVGMLWTIADQSNSSSSLDYVLDKLAVLATDIRVEVRNCVVNTLFSCVVGLGQRFSSSQWERVFSKAIFAILDQTVSKTEVDEMDSFNSESLDKYKVSLHHSRDTLSKQWMTTRVLALRGIERVLRQYFDLLTMKSYESDGMHAINWLERSWDRILLECSHSICFLGGRDTLDLRLVGSDLLSLCCQVSSRRGYIAADARVGTNMEVVNGALRTVRPSEHSSRLQKSASEEILLDPEISRIRDVFFTKSYSHLISFGRFLSENKDAIRNGDNGVNMQILSKFGEGLSDIYESCKENELNPTNCDSQKEEDFVSLLKFLCESAKGPPKGKFLSQAQKPCLDLLKTMVLHSSSRALRVLAQLAKESFCSQVSVERDKDVLGTEAGRLLSEICCQGGVNVKIHLKGNGLLVSLDFPDIADNEEETSVNTKENNTMMLDNTIQDQAAKLKEENRQLNEINAELMKQFEKLRQDKERLEQQVAVLSEGSAYI